MSYDPSQSYSPGATTPGGDGSFPTTGANATQDSVYGISAKLAVVPVKITNEGTATVHQIPGVTASSRTYGAPDVPGLTTTSSNVLSWESALALFYQMAPTERASIEDQLFAAGFYPDGYYAKNPKIRVPGEADSDSFQAWYNALEEAVRGSTYENGQIKNARSVQDVISERLSLQQQAQVAAAGRTNPVTLTNADTLKAHLENAAQHVLGMKHSASDEANFTKIYHDSEVAAGQPDAQGNYTQAPDAASFAEQWLRQRYPVESEVNDMLNAGNTAVNVFEAGPGGPTLPTTSQMP